MNPLLMMLAVFVGCGSEAADYHVSDGRRGTAVRCVAATVERVEIRGISSPSITDFNTRAVARTSDGKVVWWDYSRSLLPRPALEPGRVIHLLLDSSGAAAGLALECPPNLEPPEAP